MNQIISPTTEIFTDFRDLYLEMLAEVALILIH